MLAENVVSYTAPRGDTELEDLSYDGYLDGGIMRGGLGQLVDGLYGADDFIQDSRQQTSGKYKSQFAYLMVDLILVFI